MKKEIKKTNEGVKISFSGDVKKQNIVTMVQNCSKGKCECMSEDTKKKIKDIKVEGENGKIQLSLEGNINIKEIQEAIDKSKELNK